MSDQVDAGGRLGHGSAAQLAAVLRLLAAVPPQFPLVRPVRHLRIFLQSPTGINIF